MCSEGTLSARDSFVYISEAVLSNHGDAPADTCPENMQCLTVSIADFPLPFLCVRVCVRDVRGCPGLCPSTPSYLRLLKGRFGCLMMEMMMMLP